MARPRGAGSRARGAQGVHHEYMAHLPRAGVAGRVPGRVSKMLYHIPPLPPAVEDLLGVRTTGFNAARRAYYAAARAWELPARERRSRMAAARRAAQEDRRLCLASYHARKRRLERVKLEVPLRLTYGLAVKRE